MSQTTEGIAHGNPPQLDSIETTRHNHLPSSFSVYRQDKLLPEFQLALSMYSDYDRIKGTKNAEKLLECKQYAFFVWNEKTGKVKVVSNACRLRWCPICSQERRLLIKTSVSSWLKTVKKPKFITLTVKHSDVPLVSQIKNLYRQFQKLRRHKFLKKKIRGGIWFFQITQNANTLEYHPHLHIVADSDYIDKYLLSAEWQLTTGNSYIIDIRAVKDSGKVSDYVARYCSNACNMSNIEESSRCEIAVALHGRRLFGAFGSGRKLNVKPQKPVDAVDWKRLGSWHYVVTGAITNDRLRKVLHCWTYKKQLDADTYTAVLEKAVEESPMSLISLNTPVNRQYYFEEFVRR